MSSPVARWGGITFDCHDPELLAAFWAALLETSIRGRWEQYVNLHPFGGQPGIAFQRVEVKTAGKNALHLDIHVRDDREVEEVAQRARGLGARFVERLTQDDTSWVVLEDPEGNRFCIVAVPSPGTPNWAVDSR